MRRKRRRIQYYNAEPTKERLRDKPWLPFALVALAALVIALIVVRLRPSAEYLQQFWMKHWR